MITHTHTHTHIHTHTHRYERQRCWAPAEILASKINCEDLQAGPDKLFKHIRYLKKKSIRQNMKHALTYSWQLKHGENIRH
jgi:hypothetical protein